MTLISPSAKDIARFWKFVDRRGDDECWPWLGFHDPDGYARFGIGGLRTHAATIAYAIGHGPIEVSQRGPMVCHTCDNGGCVNFVKHLYLGTPTSNAQDRVARGRSNSPKGEKHPQAIFTQAQVDSMREEYDKAEDKRGIKAKLARKYKTYPNTIGNILNRVRWKE